MTYTYKFELDIDRDGTFGNNLADITTYVKSVKWRFGATSPFQRVATPSTGEIVLDNRNGDFSLHDSNATYYGNIHNGTLLRLTASYEGLEEVFFVLSIQNIFIDHIQSKEPSMRLQLTDIMTRFMAASFNPRLQTNVRTDEVLKDIFDRAGVIYPYDGAYFYIGYDSIGGTKEIYDNSITSFEEGYTTLGYAGDNNDEGNDVQIQGFVRDIVDAEINGFLYFDPRTELLKFFNRYHVTFVLDSPVVERGSSAYITMKEIEAIDYRYWREPVNHMEFGFNPRQVGTAQSVIYSSDQVPFALDSHNDRVITARFRDPNNEAGRVGASDVLPLLVGTDLIANTASDGSGDDVSQQVKVSLDIGADKSIIELRYDKPDAIYVTKLQQRGTPLLYYDKQTIEDENSDSIYNNGRYTRRVNNRSISDIDTARAYVAWHINALSNPSQSTDSITMVITPGDIAVYALQITVGDLITILDEQFVETIYMIVGEEHTITRANDIHRVKWILRPKLIGNAFIIDVSVIGSNDLILV